jgi:glycosyltransferase involved in cell wall biosynthesis
MRSRSFRINNQAFTTLKVSIVTVCRDSESTIEETILSVAAQKYANREHLIIDGASTDGTLEIIRRHPRITRWLSEPDRGIYDAMNKGIALSTGDVIGLLNSDDVYVDDTVLSQVAEAFIDPQVEACFADLIYVNQHDPKRIVRYWKSCEYRTGLFEHGWMPAHPTFFVRRTVYERFGGFDRSFRRQADFELTLRLLAIHKIRSVYIPRIWVRMRMGGVSNSSIRGVIRGNIEAYQACRKNGLRVSPLFVIIKIVSRVPQFFMRPFVADSNSQGYSG